MKKNVLFTMILAFAFIITSCGKYEDGPGISLRSKTGRLTGTWTMTEMTYGGETFDAATLGTSIKFEFTKDDVFNMISTDTTYSGTWAWGDNKETVNITLQGETDPITITRLTNKEFWYYEEEGSVKVEYKAEKD